MQTVLGLTNQPRKGHWFVGQSEQRGVIKPATPDFRPHGAALASVACLPAHPDARRQDDGLTARCSGASAVRCSRMQGGGQNERRFEPTNNEPTHQTPIDSRQSGTCPTRVLSWVVPVPRVQAGG